VQLEPTLATVTPRAGVWVEAARLRSAVKNAGYKPGDVRYTVAGTLTQWQGRPALKLKGSERILLLQPQPGAPEAYERARKTLAEAGNRPAEVEGLFLERTDSVPLATSGSEDPAPDALSVGRVEIRH
jgi:hypothetical protein